MLKLTRLLFLFCLFLTLFSCTKEDTGLNSTDGTLTSAEGSFDVSSGSTSGGSSTNPGADEEPGVITAGEWNDLQNWGFWTNLEWIDTVNQQEVRDMRDYWKIYTNNKRYTALVTDPDQQPITDAYVQLIVSSSQQILWTARTNHDGFAELWATPYFPDNTNNLSLKATKGSFSQTLDAIRPFPMGLNEMTLTVPDHNPSNKVEIVFAVDATGSMGDEISYLQTELEDVIERIIQLGNIDLQIGSVFYRDIEDAYITRDKQLTNDYNAVLSFINAQEAEGGGDYPEAVDAAVEVSIGEIQWSTEARSRILFLLLDAPPHQEPENIDRLHKHIQLAAAKGIEIIPISASGIDKSTELLLRSMSILTNGTYVFITDHSGIGNDHLEPTIGDYEIEFLNDLLVRLVEERIR